MLCRQGLSSLVAATGLADFVVEAQKKSQAGWAETVASLKSTQWDWIICPHESIRSHLLVWQLSAKRKTGYRNRWNFWVFNERLQRPMILPEALRQLVLVTNGDQEFLQRIADFKKQTENSDQSHGLLPVPEWASMQIELKEKRNIRACPQLASLLRKSNRNDLSVARRRNSTTISPPRAFNSFLLLPLATSDQLRTRPNSSGENKKTIALAPGSVWPTKMWTLEGFADVARYFLQKGFHVSLIGSKDELPLANELLRRVPGLGSHVGEFSLVQSLEFLKGCALVLANDSGAQHMAAAMGTPCVTLFGPTTLKLGYRPWQNRARVAQIDLECRPCGRHGAKKCPLGTHACMKNLAAKHVIEKMLELCP